MKDNVIHKLSAQFEILKQKLPSYLQDEFQNTCYFAGGCIYSLWNNKEPNDWDVFCTSPEFIRKLKQWFLQTNKHDVITEYAITFKPYQFVIKFIGHPESVVMEFDFLHNMFYFRHGRIYCLSDWKHLNSNVLRFNAERARDVASTITRVPKFVSRGMTITKSEMALMLDKITNFPAIIKERSSIKKIKSGRSY